MAENELKHAIEKFARDLAAKAESFVDDISTLEVRTFTMPSGRISSLAGQSLNLDDPTAADGLQLRAYTQIDFDSDTVICVPVDSNDQVDRSVWDMHQTMVNQALRTRESMLKAMGDALSSALAALERLAG